MLKWLVITELHKTQFQSLELQFWAKKIKLEDPDPIYSDKTVLNSHSSEPLEEPVNQDIELSSKPTDQILSNNDVYQYLII